MSEPVLFVLSVDTEEEWDWSGPFPSERFCVENCRYLPAFHRFCSDLGVRPTYFTDYAVIDNAESRAILTDLGETGRELEIGAHLHPWCNPPQVTVRDERHSHVVNLSMARVTAQVDALTDRIEAIFGRRPTAFRTGRWGTHAELLQLLEERGYRVDSSVYPYYRNAWFSYDDNDARPYWPSATDAQRPGPPRGILELPVSAGFNRLSFERANRWHQRLSSWPLHYSRAIGMLWRLNWLRKIYLSPELASAEDMTALVDAMLARGERCFHLYLHSSSLMPGAGGYVDDQRDEKRLYDRIRTLVHHLQQRTEVDFCTITEAAKHPIILGQIEGDNEGRPAMSREPVTGRTAGNTGTS